MHGCGGHAWLLGGMHGCLGACGVVGGHAWLQGGMCGCWGVCIVAEGACVVAGGVHGCGGHAWLLGGACMVAGGDVWLWACIGYDKIRSMSGQYTSYWNAFLFMIYFMSKEQIEVCHLR